MAALTDVARDAGSPVATRRGEAGNGSVVNSNGDTANGAEIEAVVEVSDDSRQVTVCVERVASGKPLIPLETAPARTKTRVGNTGERCPSG